MKRLGALLLSLTLAAGVQNVPQKLYWAMSWGASPQKPVPANVLPASVFENTTIRQIVPTTAGTPS
jgi:hypothetical protein